MDVSLNFDTSAFERAMIENPKEIQLSIRKSLMTSAQVVQRKAKINAPFITGNLKRNIKSKVFKDVAKIGTDVIYARIHELGGIITPKRAKYLRFKVGGKWVATKRVVMPKRPYLQPALEDSANEIRKIFVDNIKKVI